MNPGPCIRVSAHTKTGRVVGRKRRPAGLCLGPHLHRQSSVFSGSGSHRPSLSRLRPEPGEAQLDRGASITFFPYQLAAAAFLAGRGSAVPPLYPPPPPPRPASTLSLPVQRSPQLSADHTCRHLTKASRRKITSLPSPFPVPAFLEPKQRTLLGTSPEFLHFRCSSNRPLSWPLSTRRLHYGKRDWGWGTDLQGE